MVGRFRGIEGDDVTPGGDDGDEDFTIGVYLASVSHCTKSTRCCIHKDVAFDDDWFTEIRPCEAPRDFSVDEEDYGFCPGGELFLDDRFEL